MSSVKQKKLYEAAISRFRAQRDEAMATLEVYLNNSVAVGEHPTLVDDISELTKKLAEAEECMEVLTKHFKGGGCHSGCKDRGNNCNNCNN